MLNVQQHLTFKKQRSKMQKHASLGLEPTPCNTAPLQHCMHLGQNLSCQWDRLDLLTRCQVSRVLASSIGGSNVEASRPCHWRHPPCKQPSRL